MKKLWKIAALVLSLVLVVGCFAACGSSDDVDEPDAGAEATSEAGTTEAAESDRLADGVLGR